MLRDSAILGEAHHRQVGQVTAPDVVALIDCLDDLVVVFEKNSLLTQLNFKRSLGHFQSEPHTWRGIPETIDCRMPREVERQVSLINPSDVPELTRRTRELLQGFQIQTLFSLHCNRYGEQKAVFQSTCTAQCLMDEKARKSTISIHERV
ncbi:hypothetical protein D3C72_1974440 [compost metagenome]